MPRKSSGRPAPRPAGAPHSASKPPHHSPSPPPAVASNHSHPPAPMQPSGSGYVLGGIAGTIADGMAFGTGSAIAHRAVDAVIGPRVVQHESTTVAAPAAAPTAAPGPSIGADSCAQQAKIFQDCISGSGNDISKCQYYLDLLNECKKSLSVGL